jgi:DNA-binding SARP family transcriptional activator
VIADGLAAAGAGRPPHVRRLVRRVRALDGPLIQIWSWPGGGQQAVLDALTEDARLGQPLSLDDLGDEVALTRAVDAAVASGARWLVLPAVPSLPAASPESAGIIARRLRPGQRLVFAAPRRRPAGPLACSYLLPQELLLNGQEIAELWQEVAGTAGGGELVERLGHFTDGWYRPLRLAAEAAAEAGGWVEPDALVELPAVASFLRHEVLELLSPDEREVLVALSAGRSLEPELWRDVLAPEQEALRRRIVEVWGLGMETDGSLRLPYLLRWFLSRQRRARWGRDRRRRFAGRLAEVELALDRPVEALEHLAEAEQAEAAAELVERHWPVLFARAPLGLLTRFPQAPSRQGPGGELVARVAEALLAGREVAGPEMMAGAGTAAVAAAGALVAAVTRGTGAPGAAAALPPELAPLGRLAAVTAAGGPRERGDADDEPDAAMARALVPVLAEVDPGARTRRRDPGVRALSPLQALFGAALDELLRRRPGVAARLAARDDLPAPWRRWLAGRPLRAGRADRAGFEITLLGRPTVRLHQRDGRATEVLFPLRRALEVFAYLATSRGFAAAREELVEAVWAHADEETVAKNFHPTLSHLRRSLRGPAGGPPLVLRRGVYRLGPGLAWNVDVADFLEAVEEGERRLREGQSEPAAEAWRGAWSLYGGPLLEGWDAPWVAHRREEVQRRYLEMLRQLGEVEERLGHLSAAVDALRTALAADPLQEPVHQALMRLYARQGRRDHVRRQYERLVAQLADELGVEPLPETTATYHRLMA